ncbi:tetratricopeptide repeat-containing sensor histidine kinase [Bacteroides sp.]
MRVILNAILIILGLFFVVPAYALDNDAATLSTVQSIINNLPGLNQNISSDSILILEKQLEPELLRLKKYRKLFQLKQIAAAIYATRGDINIALDYASTMYKTAQLFNCNSGIALSYHAIGDAYLNANMQKEAIEAYQEAMAIMVKLSDSDALELQVLPTLILTMHKMGKVTESQKYIDYLEKIYHKNPANATYGFSFFICKANYYIVTGQKAKAKEMLAKAEKESERYPCILYHSILLYIQAAYFEANQQYDLALDIYNKLIMNSSKLLPPYKYIQIKQEEARVLAKMGKTTEASQLYKKIYALKDSVDAQSYTRQINELHATYQIDQMDIQNQKQRNEVILWIIIATALVALFAGLLIWRFKKENKRLRQSQKRQEAARKTAENSIHTKSLFLSNMSHEIRTPLNALSGFSSILTDPSIDKETRRQCNDIIQQNSELLLKLINDVIDLSSLEVGKLTLHIKEYDAVSICRNVVDTVEKIKQTQASIFFKTSLESLTLETDASRLQQVLINLLINATKFTTQGSITLELEKDSEDVILFSVTDTGCGIQLEKQDQIFNRFEKLNEQAQGTGLGLSICQLIIHQIGGKIWIDPAYSGGARFCFTHPLHPANRKEEKQ